ncbi:hypothetical protein [Chitinasiproducens palmae]|uniref:Lipoprotein n=1 Tax=Chitinasiproducens palmae TaxID=1770053 RepID=A0A1H2PVH1_9BURK|nr:hypothetical protein [Chitinasiproducens palmae]SDV50912.1 hypothetical protein SAMN05216551_11421 [Chitinasiproducens palmae]
MKVLLMALACALACAGCAPVAPRANGGHVEMYGTIDSGVTVHD